MKIHSSLLATFKPTQVMDLENLGNAFVQIVMNLDLSGYLKKVSNEITNTTISRKFIEIC